MDYSQFKNKPFQVISKLQVRYTGIFEDIDQESQTICLSEVFNHGTEDRVSDRVLPSSPTSLGWVRFHTNSIDSLALVENYKSPLDDQPIDPILASVSKNGPSKFTAVQSNVSAGVPSGNGLASLPPKPVGAASAATALDRVQKSLGDLSVDGGRRRKPQPPPVPDAEFDFTKGTERFQKERQAQKNAFLPAPEVDQEPAEVGEPLNQPHPSAFVNRPVVNTAAALPRKDVAYNKASFFDNISADTARVNRSDERHRNLDTFGEAGGVDGLGANAGARVYGVYQGGRDSEYNPTQSQRGRGRGGHVRGGGRGGHFQHDRSQHGTVQQDRNQPSYR